ncbi:MAG: hypothetical protein ACRDYU_04575 [Actinomycetes bacterium]
MIELRVFGSPEQGRDAASALRRLAAALTAVSDDVRRGVEISDDGWSGDAAEGYRAASRGLYADVRDTVTDVGRAADGLDAFSGSLEAVQGTMQQVRARALAGGLPVSGDTVGVPVASVGTADLASTHVHETRVTVYEELSARAAEARAEERAAHERLQCLVGDLKPAMDRWLETFGVIPPDHLGPAGVGIWASGFGVNAVGVGAEWLTKVRYGDLVSAGRHAASTGTAKHVIALRALEPGNWQAAPGYSVVQSRWATVGKFSGIAGGVLAGGTSALDQWAEDRDRRDLSASERYRRATAQGFGTGAGAAAGAWAGTQAGAGIGAAVGSAFLGPGTVVGGAVGGVVGGIAGGVAGTEVGDEIGDWLADRIG